MATVIWLIVIVALSASMTALLRRYATRRRLFDVPNERSSHTTPTPRLGGVAIAVAALASWAGMTMSTGGWSASIALLGAGAAIAAVVGFIDDLHPMSPPVKLAGELAAVLVLIVVWAPSLTWVSGTVIALCVLSYVNFFNFMDGSDGLAGGVAVLTAIGLWLIGIDWQTASMQSLALAIAGAAGGFLLFNVPPARMFMGDSGSLFLGYTLGLLAVAVMMAGASPVASVLVLSPFLFDAGVTLVLRASRGEAVWQAHRSHLYQRLLRRGASHLHVAIIYWIWTVAAISLGYLWGVAPAMTRPWIAIAGFVPGLALMAYVRRRERA
jgi:UDP-N-acetylmuramyl pentapeptide phosphotransferase/UDP-N-acetylglucosamine-1-phosphate transferase